ncbi:hypothetical protein D0C16_08355 [Cellvibrio sp. KY-GH-1]|nr:hypothetical protein D0C16_08355 [Cellvibrio sp. KY-GH-1]
MENTTIANLGRPTEEEQLDWVDQLSTPRLVCGSTRTGKTRLAEVQVMPAHGCQKLEATGGLNNE